MNADPIVNRVEASGLITIDIEEKLNKESNAEIDLKEALFQGVILREKDFRQFVKEHDWECYVGKNVLLTCTADAIIPSWAYMLIVSKLEGIARVVAVGEQIELEKAMIDHALQELDLDALEGRKVVIKGCGNLESRDYYYVAITRKLVPVVSSIMYGEPCSTVPVFRRRVKK